MKSFSIRRIAGVAVVAGTVLVAGLLPIEAEASALSFGGRLKQGISWAYDHEGGDDIGPSNFLLELKTAYKPNRQFWINADVWLRGDWYPDVDSRLFDRGLQDFNSPDFRDQFGYYLGRNVDSYEGEIPFGHNSSEIRLYDDWNDIIRDLTINYRNRSRTFSIKLGKFQHGWGQSDGLRLIDILNPQDFRQRFALEDAENIRIPQTGISLGFDFSRTGFGRMLKSGLGMSRSALEVVYYPQVLNTQFVVNNPTPSDQTSAGIFGFPYPALLDPVSGRGLPLIGVNLHDVEHKEWDWEEGELGVRFSFELFDAVFTLNGFYGYQDLPVVTLRQGNLLVGTNYNDPESAITSIPLGVDASTFATWGPVGYMNQLRTLGGEGGLGGLPIVGDLLNAVTGTLAPFGCTNLLVIQGCSVTFDLDLDYEYRQKVVAASMTREIKELAIGRKQVSPVLRMEASYEFDKPFNRQVTNTGYANEGVGSAALIVSPEEAISYSDQVGLMVGFDFPFWVPFWESQRGSIFTSFQFFDFYTREHENKVYQAPYMFNELEKHQRYVTGLWMSDHFNDRLALEGLIVADLSNDSIAYRQRIGFNFFGDRIRPRLEWLTFDAKREDGALGFVHDADIVEFSITYQF